MVKSNVLTIGNSLTILNASGFSAYLRGFSAIDSFLNRDTGLGVQILTSADTADLARLFEALRFPGIDLADAALDCKEHTFYFYCTDSERPAGFGQSQWGNTFPADSRYSSFSLLDFYQDCNTRSFLDRHGIYPLIAGLRQTGKNISNADTAGINAFEILEENLNPAAERTRALMDAALFLAKYFPENRETERQSGKIAALFRGLDEGPPPGKEEQRLLLGSLLTSPNPGLGLELLKSSGFISELWPELAELDKVDHSKEFHPEGNVWSHTIETFRYRKAGLRGAYDLRLSLGLLLHDI